MNQFSLAYLFSMFTYQQDFLIQFFHFIKTDSLMGSDCEDDEDEDDPIRPPISLAHLGTNGPESHLATSDLSVQSMSTDSKNNDDSDQVSLSEVFTSIFMINRRLFLYLSISFLGFTRRRSRCER